MPRPHTVPDDAGTASLHATGLYVATTTLVDDPLNRIAVAGLGYRGAASLAVLGSGVALSIAGEADAYIPAVMAVIYLLLLFYFKAIGGYKPVHIDAVTVER